jgi:hypothetical protein
MKATISTLAVVLAVTSCAATTDATQEPVLQRRVQPEVTLTGCIVQGSSPTVLIFDNAKETPNSASEKGGRYLLASTISNIDLGKHLNHVVRITGEVDMRVSAMPVREPSDPKGSANERTLTRLVVKSVTMVSERCPPVR